ncbi:carbohydrate ABC transporter permease [Lactiplantibacillus pentosus]|jgi:sn-glycerol 3-phosphate transport system permease protein|uniref:carbohydrate ABC transporter permease n=1 Tax=Lactiplantibacillus pentosus TaxID=1589 RepID=UPI000B53F155|nr:carbohydrate ABC transporter permease [Lactiplantibacillus pentosus]ASG78748.1 glycerol-3-phosphate ABC transporter permease [Lactiplantibacillus pentosus]MCT3287539.1 carbohydrate ABC transporter permease [Lactiplantibacillus pentosus]MCT3309963.1 carbohydrate ABC transporter permease [Lactiplantibacillus pentosus]MDO7804538.1 carbohydrate ABC transporter permease [Lactiplantibacillus pentosus]PRO85778.1 carbohydrate ABC transporter permease [Lactiplantibacillus pentosus]
MENTLGHQAIVRRRVALVLKYLVLSVLALIIILPFILGLWTSFLPTTAIAKGSLSGVMSWQNYQEAFTQTPILRYLFNSLVISLIQMFAHLFFASIAAYAFVFLEFKYREQLFYVVLATMMLPFEAEVIPNFHTVRAMHLLDHYAVMVIPFLTSAFGIFMLRQAFKQIPWDLKEAADVDGLSHWQFYRKVALPYSRISLLTLAAYSFLGSWNQYLWPMLTTFSNRLRPVQDGLRQLHSEETATNWGLVQASAAIVVIPTLIVLFWGQHYFKSGLNEGSVK